MFLKTDGLQAFTSSAQPNNPSGINYYQVPYRVPSGSAAQTGSWIDISQWNNVWLQARVSGSMAGTGSLRITSVSDLDVLRPSGSAEEPNSGSAVTVIQLDMPANTWVTSSATFTARWGQFVFTPTSASAGVTGSVVLKPSFSNIKP